VLILPWMVAVLLHLAAFAERGGERLARELGMQPTAAYAAPPAAVPFVED